MRILDDPRWEARQIRRLTAYALLFALAAWLLVACTSTTPFIVSGESLDATGKAFVAVGQAYNKGLDAQTVTVAQYRDWAAFAKKFQQAYGPAVQLWKSSIAVNDAALTKQTDAIIVSLVSELAKLGMVVGVEVMK